MPDPRGFASLLGQFTESDRAARQESRISATLPQILAQVRGVKAKEKMAATEQGYKMQQIERSGEIKKDLYGMFKPSAKKREQEQFLGTLVDMDVDFTGLKEKAFKFFDVDMDVPDELIDTASNVGNIGDLYKLVKQVTLFTENKTIEKKDAAKLLDVINTEILSQFTPQQIVDFKALMKK